MKFRVLVEPWATYVKSEEFFTAQGGHEQEWGRRWKPIEAQSVEDARQKATFAANERRPKIVCLCGSTRFKEAFEKANMELTHSGIIVLSVGSFAHAVGGDKEQVWGEEMARKLDELHKRKIDLADEIFVLNVGGYIGKSTRSEIEYAIANGKPVNYLES